MLLGNQKKLYSKIILGFCFRKRQLDAVTRPVSIVIVV